MQSPLNPVNAPSPDGVAFNATTMPAVNTVEQVPLVVPPSTRQSMPAGVDRTVPLPVPLPDTDNATVVVTGSVIGAAALEPPPEQAEVAMTARTAVRTCRTGAAKSRLTACDCLRIAERKWSREPNQEREWVGLAPS